jgi:signal transduction histidine kinase
MHLTRPRLLDAALAAALAVVGVFGTWGAGRRTDSDVGVDALAVVLVVATALVLSVRRTWPLPVLAVATVLTSAYLVIGYPYGPVLLSFLVAVYTVARHEPVARSVPAAVVALLVLLLHLFTNDAALPGLLGVVPASAWVVVPFAVGVTVRVLREAADRERAELVRKRVDEERMRVAQEVHDVLGHGLAAINMQANVALHVHEKDPTQAVTALDAISRTSAEALDELRATLLVVRGDDPAESRAPVPGLSRVEDLCARMRQAGLDVRLERSGTAAPLPPEADLAAYRVVQEALTNALRHGAEGVAHVRVEQQPDAVAVTVTNPVGADVPAGDGLGVPGMRTRVEAAGGRFSAGRLGDGFEVRAWLPVGDAR